MKYILVLLLVLLTALGSLAQEPVAAYKVLEYDRNGRGCDEYFRVMALLEEVQKQPGSHGMIVIYAGDKSTKLGNATAYVKGAKEYIDRYLTTNNNLKGVSRDRISVVLADGKGLFNEEFWVIPGNATAPEILLATPDWSAITGKYHFSATCFQCEPDYKDLTNFQPNFEDYTDILKRYPNYSGLVTVFGINDAIEARKRLTGKFGLPKDRYRIRILKPDSDPNTFSNGVDLFIVPGRIRVARN